jgi:peptidyl-prolyl cis-trans isomerase SurA
VIWNPRRPRSACGGGVARAVPTAALIALLAAACIVAAMPGRALAQTVELIVNGDLITNYDIEQRMKFVVLSTHKTPVRTEVINDLIDEKLKTQIGKKYKVEVTDKDVDQSYASMARNMHLSGEQLTQALSQGGVDAVTLKSRIKADITWQQIIRGKFQTSLQIRDKDVLAALETKKKDDAGKPATGDVGYDYLLRPILFVVPRGNAPLQEARRKDAEALRARFTDCNTGLPYARTLRDVVVRDLITKNSSELSPALREILDKTEVGHLTNSETTTQGIEIFALCEKHETKQDTPERREIRDKLFADVFQTQAKRYLQELRRQAMIERK